MGVGDGGVLLLPPEVVGGFVAVGGGGFVAVAGGGIGVLVGGKSVLVGTGVSVGGIGVFVGTSVSAGIGTVGVKVAPASTTDGV